MVLGMSHARLLESTRDRRKTLKQQCCGFAQPQELLPSPQRVRRRTGRHFAIVLPHGTPRGRL